MLEDYGYSMRFRYTFYRSLASN